METFSALLAICAGNSPVTSETPHEGQGRGTLMFSLICAWINGWVINREAGDLRRRRAHYDVTVIHSASFCCYQTITWTNQGSCQRIAKQQVILISEFENFFWRNWFVISFKMGVISYARHIQTYCYFTGDGMSTGKFRLLFILQKNEHLKP